MLRWLLKHLAYPALTGGSLLATAWACQRGLPLIAVGTALTALAMVAILALERLIPYSAAWTARRAEGQLDVWHLLLSERAYDAGALLTLFALAPVAGWLGRHGLGLWPTGWPLWAQSVLAMLLSDLSLYWGHRLSHTVPALWRLHAVHHTAERLDVLSVWRSHPLDNLIRSTANVAPLALLGAPPEALALACSFSGMNVLLTHANADLRTGFLDLFLSTPAVHRWHHARVGPWGEANYAPTLALWDHVFRSRRIPAGPAPEAVGTDALGELGQSYLAQMVAPFRWHTGGEVSRHG
jgi:sterol desaturase/sphingolipid hydroxylase (fatty acid hydroxylase superfamily)